MREIAFVISTKRNELRRAILPEDLQEIKYTKNVYIEKGYGKPLGYADKDYANLGCIVTDREEALAKDIVCDLKIGDATYINKLKNCTVFGWVHAVQNKKLTDIMIANNITAYAWEEMFKDGRHVFARNNEIAGEAAIMHAYQCYGIMPYNTKVALLGRGNIARGALKVLTLLGADVTVYSRKTEKLFIKNLGKYDVVVNAILWDVKRKDHIIYKDDLKRMKENALIIDISCDRKGAIETSTPTGIDDPVYMVDGIMHYVVDHTPALFYRTTSKELSKEVCKYIDLLVEGKESIVLTQAKIMDKGVILDNKIKQFQKRA